MGRYITNITSPFHSIPYSDSLNTVQSLNIGGLGDRIEPK